MHAVESDTAAAYMATDARRCVHKHTMVGMSQSWLGDLSEKDHMPCTWSYSGEVQDTVTKISLRRNDGAGGKFWSQRAVRAHSSPGTALTHHHHIGIEYTPIHHHHIGIVSDQCFRSCHPYRIGVINRYRVQPRSDPAPWIRRLRKKFKAPR
jgi:hypothetical protein